MNRLYYKHKAKEALQSVLRSFALLILLAALAFGCYALTVDLRTGAVIIGAALVVLVSDILIARDAMISDRRYLAEAQDHMETKRMKSAEDDDVLSVYSS